MEVIVDDARNSGINLLSKAQKLSEIFGDKHGKKRLFILYILLHEANGLLQPALLNASGLTSSHGVQSLKPLLESGLIVYSETKKRVPGGSTRSASYTVFLTDAGRNAVQQDLPAILKVLQEQGWIDEDGNL